MKTFKFFDFVEIALIPVVLFCWNTFQSWNLIPDYQVILISAIISTLAIFLMQLSNKKGWYLFESFGVMIVGYVLDILITKIVVIQPIAFYPIISILVISIFIYLKYEPSIKRAVTEFRNDHPERRDDEIFWGNCRSKEFNSLRWETKRSGKISYNSQGHKVKNPKIFPVFVKRMEIKNSENGNEILEELIPFDEKFAF